MCGSMADIQSATAEIRRGKKEERKKEEETTGQKYNGLPYSIGRLDHKKAKKCYRNKNNVSKRCVKTLDLPKF